MWIETNAAVYSAIYATHRGQIEVYGSSTDTMGVQPWSGGKPNMSTEWAIKGCAFPLIKVDSTKENTEQQEWDNKYYLYSPTTKEVGDYQ